MGVSDADPVAAHGPRPVFDQQLVAVLLVVLAQHVLAVDVESDDREFPHDDPPLATARAD